MNPLSYSTLFIFLFNHSWCDQIDETVEYAVEAISLGACSAKKCDNLLLETDIFAILGVSLCVTRNDFNFIEIKKQELRGTV